MAAHLHEASIVETPFADEDRLHRSLHIVVDATSAGALEQGERPVVGVKHHLLSLARITPHKQHPAVAEPDMGRLHDHRYAIQQNHLVAPVELVGFSRRKAQRDVGCSRRLSALLAPPSGVTTHGVVATVIATPAQLFKDPDQRQLLASSLARIPSQQSVELCFPSSQLRPWLDHTLVLERGLARPQHLPHRVPRYLQVPGDLLDRLALDEVLAPNPGNRLHDQHSQPPASLQSRQRNRPTCRGSILDADPPAQGVNIAGRMTMGSGLDAARTMRWMRSWSGSSAQR